MANKKDIEALKRMIQERDDKISQLKMDAADTAKSWNTLYERLRAKDKLLERAQDLLGNCGAEEDPLYDDIERELKGIDSSRSPNNPSEDDKCPRCSGKGWYLGIDASYNNDRKDCEVCHGTGKVRGIGSSRHPNSPSDKMPTKRLRPSDLCPVCAHPLEGFNKCKCKTRADKCQKCNGKGRILFDESKSSKIFGSCHDCYDNIPMMPDGIHHADGCECQAKKCTDCNGTGKVQKPVDDKCPKCDGTGYGGTINGFAVKCPDCSGTGKKPNIKGSEKWVHAKEVKRGGC